MRKLKTSEIIFIIFILACMVILPNLPQSWGKPAVLHSVAFQASKVQQNWYWNNLFLLSDSFFLHEDFAPLAVGDGKVFLVGGDAQRSYLQVFALDASNGNKIWTRRFQGCYSILYHMGLLVIGGTGVVISINPMDGKNFWATTLNGRAIDQLDIIDNVLYANNYFAILPQTGEVISEGLPAQRRAEDWVYYLNETVVIDTQTNQVNWKTDRDIVSNIVINGSKLFALIRDGQLLQVNLLNGKITPIVKFDPTPFLYQHPETMFVYNYYLATVDNQIYVYTGDSAQLFAFEIDS